MSRRSAGSPSASGRFTIAMGRLVQLDQEDFKQSLAKLALKPVQVRDEAIIVEVGL